MNKKKKEEEIFHLHSMRNDSCQLESDLTPMTFIEY